MRQSTTANSSPAAISVRLIVLALIAAALVFTATRADPAGATHGGTFSFTEVNQVVSEGNTAQLAVVHQNRSSTEPVTLGVNIQLISAEASDLSNNGEDFCFPISGAISNPFYINIGTNADADTDDETFSVTLTLSSASVPCANGHAVVGGPETITVTIDDTGTGGGGGGNTFEFVTTASSGEEGDLVTLNVLREGDLDGTASVDCNVVGGTAESADYDVIDGTANFGDNDPSGTCQFLLETDADVDVIETILVRLQNPSTGHTVTEPDEHTITIVDDDAEIIQFSQASYTVDENGGTASFTVTRTNPSGDDTVVCRTVEQSNEADEDVDYGETDDVLEFTGTATTRTCTVPIINDSIFEGDETFRLTLEISSGDAVLGPNDDVVVTIDDDESNVTYRFEEATYTVQENAGTVVVTVIRSSNVGSGSVQWDVAGGTATAGVDYVDTSGTLTFAAGQTEQTFSITILSTVAVEPNETILLELENPVNGTLGTPNQAVVTITEIGIPTITDINPDNIPTAGGVNVVITGTNFTGATAVTFGGINATSFVINNSTQITAVAPARNAGTYDIRVTTPAGTSANTANDDITYGAATSVTYQLSARWSLIAWLGKNNASIPAALQGTVALSSSLQQNAPNNIYNVVTAVATWNNSQQRYLFWFPAGSGVPGANDITTFQYGTPYWIAITSNVTWTVIQGP